jgi:putative hemolysin
MDIAIIFGLILLNGLFAMSEIALVSSRQVRLQQAADDGSDGAKVALRLSREPTRFLSTVQVGITLIGILAGAFGEGAIAKKIEAWLVDVPLLAPYAHPLSITAMVVIITYFSLIFGELVPKRLGLMNPELIARLVARPMDLLSLMARPLVALLSVSTEVILRLLRARKVEESDIIEEEIHSLMQQGTESGVLEESEHAMVKNVLRLDDQRVGNMMTLRKELYYIDITDDLDENRRKIAETTHARIPVCKGNIDNVIGILHTKDLLDQIMRGDPLDIAGLLRRPLVVPRYASGLQLLEQFKKSKSHVAIVVDEHGQTSGLVSVNDVMTAIVGDLPAEDEEYEPDFIERDDGSWLVSGQVDIAAFKDRFRVKNLPEEEFGNYHTLGGLVLTLLGHVPKSAEILRFAHLQLEVMDMDGNRVDKVLVTRIEEDVDVSPEAQSSYRD